MTKAMSIYLAGPEVFLPDARDILKQKSSIAREIGFDPIAPGDADIAACEMKFLKCVAISAYDEKLMSSAAVIVANLTPFRGVSADTGTYFELGFMRALGRHVYAYTNDRRHHFERVSEFFDGEITFDAAGEARTRDGLLVADFDMIDNLMMHGGVEN